MFGGVDRSGDIQASGVEDFEGPFGNVDPDAFGENVNGWVIHCYGIEDPAAFVDFEEAVYDGVNLNRAIVDTGRW